MKPDQPPPGSAGSKTESGYDNRLRIGFSAERLFRVLNALDEDVQIIVRKKPARARRGARVSVAAA